MTTSFILADREKFIQCPYSVAHQITNEKIIMHLERCRRNYLKTLTVECQKTDMKICRYNHLHHFPSPEIAFHEERCPDAFSVVRHLAYHASEEGEKFYAERRQLDEKNRRRRSRERRRSSSESSSSSFHSKRESRTGSSSSRLSEDKRRESYRHHSENQNRRHSHSGSSTDRHSYNGDTDRHSRSDRKRKRYDEDRTDVRCSEDKRIEEGTAYHNNHHRHNHSERYNNRVNSHELPEESWEDANEDKTPERNTWANQYCQTDKGHTRPSTSRQNESWEVEGDGRSTNTNSTHNNKVNDWGMEEEDWEADCIGNFPGYDPQRKLKNEIVIVNPQGLTKSQRKQFRNEVYTKAQALNELKVKEEPGASPVSVGSFDDLVFEVYDHSVGEVPVKVEQIKRDPEDREPGEIFSDDDEDYIKENNKVPTLSSSTRSSIEECKPIAIVNNIVASSAALSMSHAYKVTHPKVTGARIGKGRGIGLWKGDSDSDDDNGNDSDDFEGYDPYL